MKWLRRYCLALFATVLLIAGAQAQEEAYVPEKGQTWRMRGQFAGFQGLISVGGGPVLAKGHWRPALMYGYAPPHAGREAVHQFILRNDLVFGRMDRKERLSVAPTASLNMLVETGRHSYLWLPDRYPAGYYMAPMPRFTLGMGGRLDHRFAAEGAFRSMAFTAEVVGLDAYMWYAVSERGFPLYAAFGLSLGVELLW